MMMEKKKWRKACQKLLKYALMGRYRCCGYMAREEQMLQLPSNVEMEREAPARYI